MQPKPSEKFSVGGGYKNKQNQGLGYGTVDHHGMALQMHLVRQSDVADPAFGLRVRLQQPQMSSPEVFA